MEKKEPIYTTLDKFQIASPFSKELFIERAQIAELPKNEIIFIEGKKNQSEYLLLSGVAHRYNISDKGRCCYDRILYV